MSKVHLALLRLLRCSAAALLGGMSLGFKIVGPRARVSESKVLLAGMGVRRYIVRARVWGSMGDRE